MLETVANLIKSTKDAVHLPVLNYGTDSYVRLEKGKWICLSKTEDDKWNTKIMCEESADHADLVMITILCSAYKRYLKTGELVILEEDKTKA